MGIKLRRDRLPSCATCGHDKDGEVVTAATEFGGPTTQCVDVDECRRREVLANLDIRSSWVL